MVDLTESGVGFGDEELNFGALAGFGEIGEELLKEIYDRIKFMLDVGLHYLTLNRPAPSLSGGEGQRIRLATQVGSLMSRRASNEPDSPAE